MNREEFFNNKKIIFILTFILELVVYFIFSFYIFESLYLTADISMVSILGLMFGPVGALGSAFATSIADYLLYGDLTYAIFQFFIMFIVAYLPYKLWYTIRSKDGLYAPKFDSAYNIFKYLFVIILSGSIYFIIQGLFFNVFNVSTEILANQIYLNTINYIDFSIFLGISLITIANFCKIPLQKPVKSKYTSPIPKELINFSLLLIIVIGLFTAIFFNHIPYIYNLIIFILLWVLTILYLLKPYDFKEPVKVNPKNTLIEKMNFIILGISVLFIIVFILLIHFNLFSTFFVMKNDFSILVYGSGLYFAYILLAAVFLNYVEKNITQPIEKIAETTKTYVMGDELAEKDDILQEYAQYSKRDNEFGVLSTSFTKMVEDLDTYMLNFKRVTSENQRYETELNVAESIQLSMLPTNFKEISEDKNFSLYATMSPAKEVGGDFYDFFLKDENHLIIAVGDVSGKGIPGALFMVKTITLGENSVKYAPNLADSFFNLNNQLCENNDGELFVTNFAGILELSTGKFSYVNAGHNYPLIKTNGESFEYLENQPDLILAVMENTPYQEHTIQLNKGDMIFLYTDGLTEANNNYQSFYGEEQLKETLNKNKDEELSKILESVKKDIKTQIGESDQFDDETMLILKYE